MILLCLSCQKNFFFQFLKCYVLKKLVKAIEDSRKQHEEDMAALRATIQAQIARLRTNFAGQRATVRSKFV